MCELSRTELYPFTQADMAPERLAIGVDHSLDVFTTWRDANPDKIAAHISDLTDTIDTVANAYTVPRRLGRLALPFYDRFRDLASEREFVEYFGLHNLGEELAPNYVEFLRARIHAAQRVVDSEKHSRTAGGDFIATSCEVITQLAPELRNFPELDWLATRLKHLHLILPEAVIQQGALGKVIRTTAGVITIAAYDVADEPIAVRRQHLQHVMPGAYALGATYALIDDILQSNNSPLGATAKNSYHEIFLEAMTTGQADRNHPGLPDHPITDELYTLCDTLLNSYPFEQYRHLYYAIESMYCAQYRDAQLTPEIVAMQGGRKSMYRDMTIKASMTRVIANILGRRSVSDENYTKFLNAVLGSQLKDDFEDQMPDEREGNCTIFTLPYESDSQDPNPLYDLFGFDAYVRHKVWEGHPNATDRLIRYGASEFGPYLATHKKEGEYILSKFPSTPEIERFVLRAIDLTKPQAQKILPLDMAFEHGVSRASRERPQTDIHPITFLTDRLEYINDIIGTAISDDSLLGEIATYSLEAGGKRLRPGLTLMLAEGLSIPYQHVEPLLKTAELFHTSSLIFDDLPAQDNSTLRRGRPTAHTIYPEWGAQLAGLAMISRGFGVTADLAQYFPAERVIKVLQYADRSLGFEGLSHGQAMDLNGSTDRPMTLEAILEMYHFKTSVAIEAALVPLMILTDRPEQEITQIKSYAHHAGIVFQIKDDILDVTAHSSNLGKDTQNDINKSNVVQLSGLEEAQILMEHHLQAALESLQQLPFNTNLLRGVVQYFAHRRK